MKPTYKTRIILLFFAIVVLYALSLFNFTATQTQSDAQSIQKHLHQAERDILNDSRSLGLAAQTDADLINLYEIQKRKGNEWARKGFYFLIFKNDSLYYWSDNRISFSILTPIIIEDNSVIKLRNGWFETFNQQFSDFTVISLLLIKNDYVNQNRFLQNNFNDILNIDRNNYELKTSPVVNGLNINSSNGNYLFSLERIASPVSGQNSFGINFNNVILLIFLVLIIYFIFLSGNYLLTRQGYTILKFLFPLVVLLLLLFSIIFKLPSNLYELRIFSSQLYASSEILSSLGVFFFVSIWLLFATSFYYRLHSIRYLLPGKVFLILLTILYYLFIVIVNKLIYGLIINSNISFDVNDLFSLSSYSLIGFISITALLFSVYIIAQAIADKAPVNNRQWLAVLNIPTFLLFLILNLFDLIQTPIELLVWALIFLFVLFRITRSRIRFFDFSLFLPVIILLSAFSGFIIFKYNKEKEQSNRLVMAQRLERERDFVAEYLFDDISGNTSGDRLLSGLMANPYQNSQAIERRINQLYFTGYWNKYETSVYIFDSLSILYYNPSDDSVSLQGIRQLIDHRGIATANQNLYFIAEESGRPRYMAFLPVKFHNGTDAGIIVVNLEARLVQEQTGFPELLLSSSLNTTTDLSNYSYARYNNGRLILQHGEYAYTLKHINRGDRVENFRYVKRDKYNHLIYRSGPDSVIILTQRNNTWLDYVSVFSYMFAIFSLFTLIYGAFHIIPYKYKIFNLTFRRRIQQSMTWLVIISLLLIGTGTVIYIINSNNNQKRNQITNRLNSALLSIENELVQDGTLVQLTEEKLFNLNRINNLMSADFHIYDRTGTLLYTTQPKLFDQGITSRQMDMGAYTEVAIGNRSRFLQNERIGELKFLSAYAPLRDENNQQVGFLNLPYFARESELRNEISSFLIALVNVYLLLLVFAIIIAVLVANRLTVPLNLIRQRLGQTKLGDKNEYIQWNRNDEIGELVAEYNHMVDQLTESAELLAKSERESAWREMAKQVAHEIKNPLTPMKLSVQHLERILKDDATDKENRVKKLTQTLIQQIDTLSAIATEFSNFAKLPKPQLQEVNLVEILEGIANLYSQEENIQITMEKEVASAIIISDKDQALRIFNNVIKNAVQSIPGGKDGIIKIMLKNNGTEYLISVADNGEGIDPEMQHKIFQPNFTTKTGGMGIGLSMVKNILNSMGGRIWFESRLGLGTTFYISVPHSHHSQ